MDAEILHLYTSPGHSYFGHFGQPPGGQPMLEVNEVACVAGHGIVGDRYFDHLLDFKGQITFFDHSVHLDLLPLFLVKDVSPSVYRRNVILRGVDLNTLVGREFELQGLRFQGVEECRPCVWMEQAVGGGAENAMRGRGGLRARILTSGTLRCSRSSIANAPVQLLFSETKARPRERSYPTS